MLVFLGKYRIYSGPGGVRPEETKSRQEGIPVTVGVR